MAAPFSKPELGFSCENLRSRYNKEPIGFAHRLAELSLFQIDNLRALAKNFAAYPQDYFVAHGAPSAGTVFTAVPGVELPPDQALERLDAANYRILLKRPENHDSDFRDLMEQLFDTVSTQVDGLRRDDLVGIEGGIFITSAATTTPFHFDPGAGFFTQIAGEKLYHIYSPTVVTEPELERHYSRGRWMIGQLDLPSRDPSCETCFALKPGDGLHQPENAPHWVETTGSLSISYTLHFETKAMRDRSRARAANHYLRNLSLQPSYPGSNAVADAVKSRVMSAILPMRRTAADLRGLVRKMPFRQERQAL